MSSPSSIERLEDQTGAFAGFRSSKLQRILSEGYTFGGVKPHGHGFSVMFFRGVAPDLEIRRIALCRTIRRKRRGHRVDG